MPCGDLCIEGTTPSPVTPSPVVNPSPTEPPSTVTYTSTETDVSYSYLGCFTDSATRVLTESATYEDFSMTTEVGGFFPVIHGMSEG